MSKNPVILEQFNLPIVAELAPRKRKLYKLIWIKKSMLCKPKNKFKEKSWKISILWTVIH
jgi:hypothetical protein